MNYIFLDVDGVLNSIDFLIDSYNKNHKSSLVTIDEEAVKILATICHENSAQIILSSTWRFKFLQNLQPNDKLAITLLQYFQKYNIILAGCLDLMHKPRGILIKDYIDNYFQPNDKFVIIDDDTFDITPYFSAIHCIFTKTQKGLQKKHIAKARKKFAA